MLPSVVKRSWLNHYTIMFVFSVFPVCLDWNHQLLSSERSFCSRKHQGPWRGSNSHPTAIHQLHVWHALTILHQAISYYLWSNESLNISLQKHFNSSSVVYYVNAYDLFKPESETSSNMALFIDLLHGWVNLYCILRLALANYYLIWTCP